MCLGCFLISYDLHSHKQITASGNLPPQRREVIVRVDENCFYRAIALWRDEMSDEKHEEIHRLSSCLIEKNPTVFEPLLFSTNSVRVQSQNDSAQANHFSLLLPRGSCFNAPLPQNTAVSVSIDLYNR